MRPLKQKIHGCGEHNALHPRKLHPSSSQQSSHAVKLGKDIIQHTVPAVLAEQWLLMTTRLTSNASQLTDPPHFHSSLSAVHVHVDLLGLLW
jgi:hypothetical protein